VESVKVIDNVAIPIFIIHRNYACILYRFRDIASYLSKVANFSYPMCIWCPLWGWPNEILPRSLAPKNYRISGLLCVVVICVMIGPTFSCFYIELRLATVASFDGRTDRHRAIHTGQTVALAWCCAVKSRSSTRRPEPQYNSLVYSVIYCAWTVERSINARSVSQLYMYRRVATSDECDDIMTSYYTRRS